MRLKITSKGKLVESPWIVIKGRSLGLTSSAEAIRIWNEVNDYPARQTGGIFHLVR